MSSPSSQIPLDLMRTIEAFCGAIVGYHPRAVVLFGSALAYVEAPSTAPVPNDIDLLVVADLLPVAAVPSDQTVAVEVHRFRIDEIVSIATSLRYDPKPVILSRLYGSAVIAHHSRRIIAASMLLGPDYNRFGIEQIEIDGRADTRDYSRHRVIYGDDWWQRLQRWARERRGPLRRLSDRIVMADRFSP